MNWALLSLAAAFVWAIVSIIDKHLLTKWLKHPIIPTLSIGVAGGVLVPFLHFFGKMPALPVNHWLLFFFSSALFFGAALLYFKAIKIEEISRVIPLFYISPLFISILAAIFLGEIFTPIKYVGILLIVGGAILISLRKELKITISKAFWFMIVAAIFIAASITMTKYLLNYWNYWTVFAYYRLCYFILILPFIFTSLPKLKETVSEKGARALGFVFLNSLLNLVGMLLITIATAIGFVTLVNTISSVQPFFVIVMTVLLSYFAPRFFKEGISRKTVAFKFLAAAMIFVGALLVV